MERVACNLNQVKTQVPAITSKLCYDLFIHIRSFKRVFKQTYIDGTFLMPYIHLPAVFYSLHALIARCATPKGSSLIRRLLKRGSPSAITGFVVAVGVYSVDAVLRAWFHTHVLKKVFVLAPSFTNRNTASAIQIVVRRANTITPFFKRRPDLIFGGLATTIISSVTNVSMSPKSGVVHVASLISSSPLFTTTSFHTKHINRIIPRLRAH